MPLVAFIGRLTDQKGFDLVAAVMRDWVQSHDVQWAILGTGEPEYHELFAMLAERFPQKVAVRLEFSNALAHRIEAGADMFLMPSRYEPCGLNQLYSLKYGTVPVVRATGGLADTITDCERATAGRRHGQRASAFSDYSALALTETLGRACQAYAPARGVEPTGRRPACARTGRGPPAPASTSSCTSRRSARFAAAWWRTTREGSRHGRRTLAGLHDKRC